MANRRIALSLFLCVFAAQSGAIALSPVLAAVAADFDVSTAVVGQLRTVAGLAAASRRSRCRPRRGVSD